jgi:hypothetical protein
MFAVHRAKNSNRSAFLVETIMGEKIVKNYNRAEINMEIYKEVHDASLKQWKKIFLRNELNTPIVEFFWNRNLQKDLLYLFCKILSLMTDHNRIQGAASVFKVCICHLSRHDLHRHAAYN